MSVRKFKLLVGALVFVLLAAFIAMLVIAYHDSADGIPKSIPLLKDKVCETLTC